MKALLKRLIGADRPRIIAVIGTTREEVEAGIAHAKTAQSELPIQAWCAERPGNVRAALRRSWPALVIVAWTGRRGNAFLKLVAFTVPPFRIAIINEANGVFPAKPGPMASHVFRRLRDLSLSGSRRAFDWMGGAGKWLHSLCYRAGERLLSLLLEVLATAAQLTPALAHRQFQRLLLRTPPARRTGLPLDTCSASYQVLTLSGRVWPRTRIAKAVSEQSIDFIVLRDLNETADSAPLIEFARHQDAFAVARQIAYTGWRRQILNKHPFRRLQPGETAQVLAPWSSLIVIRRDALNSLGIPRSTTTGAALMLLFWKAAAAGWKSFVMGHDGPITQEPAMPLEDAAFVTRLSLSGDLRTLAPLSSLSRGNIAFSPKNARPFRGLPRILVVSPYLPFPLSHGGAVRIYNLCRALSNEVDFILACFHEAKEPILYPEVHEVFREVYAVDIDEKNNDPTVPKQVAEYRNTAMFELIRNLCAVKAVDIVQLEYTQMAEYRQAAGGVPTILVEHDITFTLYRQLADPTADLWLDFERKALRSADSVWTMSNHDRAVAIENGAASGAAAVIPNGVNLRHYVPEPRKTTGPVVLFVGSFRHLPNLLAFEALRESIMPAVWREMPDCQLMVIAGPDHERAARTARKFPLLSKDPRITIHGFVQDVRPAYRECDVVAIPLPVSAGTNIKLMEAMACGRAIVSTPVGCVGLDLEDDTDLLIRDVGNAFADAILTLLREPDYRRYLAVSARRTAEARFGWDRIAQDALNGVRRLVRGASGSEYRESHKFADSAIQNTSASEVRQSNPY